jgi:MerR family transcriptional regulator/heat shock protein HspR
MVSRFNEPLFVISVAARLVEMHPQTLRKYEREGLIAPSRTQGNLRLYSDRDIERLRQVKYLVEDRGLNLAGVQLALGLTQRLRDLRGRCEKDERRPTDLVGELDQILRMLGFIDQDVVAEYQAQRDRERERDRERVLD